MAIAVSDAITGFGGHTLTVNYGELKKRGAAEAAPLFLSLPTLATPSASLVFDSLPHDSVEAAGI